MGYNETQSEEKRPINNEMAEKFKDAWSEFDPKGTGLLSIHNINSLLKRLPNKLGFDKRARENERL